MKKSYLVFLSVLVLLFSGTSALAATTWFRPSSMAANRSLTTYCKDVTPGEGRVLACLYARSDKLSGQCEYALYDAAAQLERAVAALSYVVNECKDDLQKLCSEVPAGQGRLLNCLEKNDSQVSGRCKQAIKDVGLK